MKEHRFAQPGSRWSALVRRPETSLVALLLVISLILSLRTNTFFTPVNLFNILRAFSWIAVAAFGEMLVLIIGGIDLSVGAVMALAGMVSALVLQSDANVAIAVGAGLLAAALVGLGHLASHSQYLRRRYHMSHGFQPAAHG